MMTRMRLISTLPASKARWPDSQFWRFPTSRILVFFIMFTAMYMVLCRKRPKTVTVTLWPSLMVTHNVIATTCQNGTHSLLTLAKLSVGYLVVGITRELNKEPSLHCSSIYITYKWSVLQQCVYLMSYYSSTCVFLKATMLPTCALISYS